MATFVIVILCYLFVVLVIPSIYPFIKKRQPTIHYILHPKNNEQKLEWTVRALHLHAKMKGYELKITVVDRQLSHEIKTIIDMLANEGINIQLKPPHHTPK